MQTNTKEPNNKQKGKVLNIKGRAESWLGFGDGFSHAVIFDLAFEG